MMILKSQIKNRLAFPKNLSLMWKG
jgi:hypothetical protein